MNKKLLWILIAVILAATVLFIRGRSKPEFAQEVDVDHETAENVRSIVQTAYDLAMQKKTKELSAKIVKIDKYGMDDFINNISEMPNLKMEKAKVSCQKKSPNIIILRTIGTNRKLYYFILKRQKSAILLESCGKSKR